MTPEALLIIADEFGDLWRVWPNVGVWPIRSHAAASDWDRLRDWRQIADLEPAMSLVVGMAGTRWTRIRYARCLECEGSGEFRGAVVVTDADSHNVEYGHPPCEWCRGEGWTPEWAESVHAADVLGRLAA